MPLRPTEAAYFAGLVDGEGNIGVRTRQRVSGKFYITPILQVTNTNAEMLLWIQRRAGGRIYPQKESRPGRKPVWSWQIWSHGAVRVLKEIHPYLIVKKAQADLLFSVAIKERGFRLSDEERAHNVVVFDQMKRLNQRGTNHAA